VCTMDRLLLESLLESLVGEDGKVYFQPPENMQLVYPCIIYTRFRADTAFADNGPYRYTKRYLVTVIDRNPDSVIPDKVAALPLTLHNRFFAANGLNHDVFYMYF
jgi:hypothetical protein